MPAAAPALARWLLALAGMILVMIVIGGITRLTESGLSITEWKLVTGILPPLSAAAWADAFVKYQAIPEYAEVHAGMSLDQFKGIFFWEYLHRLWGRLIGLVALVPIALAWWSGERRAAWLLRLAAVPVLIGLQGALGWYMVKSGLSVRISVSQYRLTAHLALAVAAYGYIIWLAAGLRHGDHALPGAAEVTRYRRVAQAILGLVFLTLLAGGFTAGLHAGLTYNSFPLMDGRLVPEGYFSLSPWWLNPFETIAAAQFDHRCLAETSLVAIIGFWLWTRRVALPALARQTIRLMLAAVMVQVALGISTLLLVVPVPLAAAHQAGAILVFTASLLTVHHLRGRSAV